MKIVISNWKMLEIDFGSNVEALLLKFGPPKDVVARTGNRVSYYYDDINFNFEDDFGLSSVGFGQNANVILDGLNPFASINEFLEKLKMHECVDHYGMKIYREIGLIMEGFHEASECKSFSLISGFELERYLPKKIE